MFLRRNFKDDLLSLISIATCEKTPEEVEFSEERTIVKVTNKGDMREDLSEKIEYILDPVKRERLK